jgi:hypothetical protein
LYPYANEIAQDLVKIPKNATIFLNFLVVGPQSVTFSCAPRRSREVAEAFLGWDWMVTFGSEKRLANSCTRHFWAKMYKLGFFFFFQKGRLHFPATI